MGLSQTSRAPNPKLGRGSEKSPFQIAAKWLEIDENVNSACLIRHFLALNEGLENRTAFAKAPNE